MARTKQRTKQRVNRKLDKRAKGGSTKKKMSKRVMRGGHWTMTNDWGKIILTVLSSALVLIAYNWPKKSKEFPEIEMDEVSGRHDISI